MQPMPSNPCSALIQRDFAAMNDAPTAIVSAQIVSSTAQTPLAAKAIAAAFYGESPGYSYFQGCSNGGRQALMEAQRYPNDFDGIIAGAPAAIQAPLNGEYETWKYQ